jgi:hypothetical protein
LVIEEQEFLGVRIFDFLRAPSQGGYVVMLSVPRLAQKDTRFCLTNGIKYANYADKFINSSELADAGRIAPA